MSHGSTVTYRQQLIINRRKRARGVPKPSTIAVYASVFTLVVAIIAVGYHSPQQITAVASVAPSASQDAPVAVDDVVATSVAANVAQTTNLSVATNVANLAVSTQIKNQLAQISDATINKPQIIQPTGTNRSVSTYVTKDGDTVTSVAAQFNISTDTVKWANDLTSDSLSVGKSLKILPENGVLYTVKSGDTVESIASKYSVDQSRLVLYNDLDLTGVTLGSQIILPAGQLPSNERPGYIVPSLRVSYSYHYAPGFSSGDLTVINNPDRSNYIPDYVPGMNIRSSVTNAGYNGQCTWYAFFRRAAIGMPIPNTALGNAAEWNSTLSLGHVVDSVPSRGAIIQNGGGAGHVGIVEAVNGDGSIVISEMNNYSAGGSYVVDVRTVPAYAVGFFNYIH